ncbi:MAG: LptF/LptG family permease [Myxococcota bacterium]
MKTLLFLLFRRGLSRVFLLSVGLTSLVVGWELLEQQRLLSRRGAGPLEVLSLALCLSVLRLQTLVGLAGMLSAWRETQRLEDQQERVAFEGLGGRPSSLLLSLGAGLLLSVGGLLLLSKTLQPLARAELEPYGLQRHLGAEPASPVPARVWQWEGERLVLTAPASSNSSSSALMEPSTEPPFRREWFLWQHGQQHGQQHEQLQRHTVEASAHQPGGTWERLPSGSRFDVEPIPSHPVLQETVVSAPAFGAPWRSYGERLLILLSVVSMLIWQFQRHTRRARWLGGLCCLLFWSVLLLLWQRLG